MAEHRYDRLFSPLQSLQHEALEVLWSCGTSSIRQVADKLDGKRNSGVAYNTVASALNNLCKLGFATRVRAPGSREYLYSALVAREQLEKAATAEAVEAVFEKSRSSRSALSYLVEIVGDADGKCLEDLRNAVEQKRQAVKSSRSSRGSS